MARALATPIGARLARYDVVILPGAASNEEFLTRIAVEFARHEHRVFQFGSEPRRQDRSAAPTSHRLPWPRDLATGDVRVLSILESLRQSKSIDAAVLVVPANLDPAIAAEIRRRWGWRLLVLSDAPTPLAELADVRIVESDHAAAAPKTEDVVFPSAMGWPGRWAALDRALRTTWPRASIVVVTWDNLAFTRLCLSSILENTEYPNYEVIIVDNASTDGTVEELHRLAGILPHVQIIINDHNAGFAPANNQGLAEATGELLILLNNDTVVPRGWLTRLARHLEDERIGLLGPATNRTCNEAQIDLLYQTYGEFQEIARTQIERHEGERYPIRMPMMFCLALRRDTFELLGSLDERYETGMFEDEDYALRAKDAGLIVAWTPEVYVHHAYHASIGKLLPSGEYMRLVKQNQGRFEEKWGICWERHRPVPTPTT